MKMKNLAPAFTAALTLALGLLFAPACSRAADAAKDGFGELTVDEVAALIEKKDISVFDNNGKARFEESHLPTATWVKFNDVQAGDLPADLERKLVFYCANSH